MSILRGVRILDLTRVLAGPYCSMILGDLGAEIIKVERPIVGDDSREFGPFSEGESGYFNSINRNKKSITIDLKKEKGKAILKELLKKADVVIENFRPGTMEKLGFGYEEVSKINNNIIYASVSGFGQTGPYSKKPAYDAIVQAMGGIMSITGNEKGNPTRIGSSIGDITAGLYCAIGVLSALYKKSTTGKGEQIDISMLDCQLSLLENAIARYSLTGEIPKPMGNRHSSIVPFETFETKDGVLMIAIGNDKLWEKFCDILDDDELKAESFRTNEKRNVNYIQLKEKLSKLFVEKSTQYWEELLNKYDIPNSQINTIDKVLENEQVKARNMIICEKLNNNKELLMPSSPLKFNNNKFEYTKAPKLGENTLDILGNFLRINETEIQNLIKEKVI